MHSTSMIRLTAALTLATTLVAACGSDDSDNSADGRSVAVASTSTLPPAPVESSTGSSISAAETGEGGLPVQDSFQDDRLRWGEVHDPQFGDAVFTDGDYVWTFTGRYSHWLPGVLGDMYDAGKLEMRDVTVSANVTITAGGGVVGVFCRDSKDTDAQFQWYEFVVRDGYAAIRHADDEGHLDVLAETNDLDAPLGMPISIVATCKNNADGQADLSMTVNDSTQLHATDAQPLGNGVSGLQVWTFPMHEQIDIRWHDFSATQPDE